MLIRALADIATLIEHFEKTDSGPDHVVRATERLKDFLLLCNYTNNGTYDSENNFVSLERLSDLQASSTPGDVESAPLSSTVLCPHPALANRDVNTMSLWLKPLVGVTMDVGMSTTTSGSPLPFNPTTEYQVPPSSAAESSLWSRLSLGQTLFTFNVAAGPTPGSTDLNGAAEASCRSAQPICVTTTGLGTQPASNVQPIAAVSKSKHPARSRGGARARADIRQATAAAASWVVDRRSRDEIRATRDPELHEPRGEQQQDLQEEEFRSSQAPTGSYQLAVNGSMMDSSLPLIPPEPEHQALSAQGYYFIIDICVACQRLMRCISSNGVNDRLNILFQNPKNLINLKENGITFDASVKNLISQLAVAENDMRKAEFAFMIGTIQFRNKIASICKSTSKKKTDVIKSLCKETGKSESLLATYVSDGAKYTILAGGGTIFLLAIIAITGLKSDIRNIRMDIILRLSYSLKCPSPTNPAGQSIIRDIIPLISTLRQKFRMTFTTMFSEEIAQLEGITSEIEVGDLKMSDTFFNKMTYNALIKQRCPFTWQSCFEPLDTTVKVLSCPPTLPVPLLPFPVLDIIGSYTFRVNQDATYPEVCTKEVPVRVINTDYDPLHPRNIAIDYRKNAKKPLPDRRFLLTKAERKNAENPDIPKSLEELEKMLRLQLRLGKKTRDKYIQIKRDIYRGEPLRINDCNGDFLSISCPHLPEDLRNRLYSALKLCIGAQLIQKDSAAEGRDFVFSALHFYWWNKYGANGQEAPSDIEPAALKKEGKKRLNTAQFTPHTTKEYHTYSAEYKALKTCFEEVFEWIKNELERLLPAECKIVAQFADVLPGDAVSPCHPFSGFVINLNVTTQIHRDSNDKILCVVMVISSDDCEGGDLCLLELGLRLELKNGDMVIFRSKDITHFNLHFKGERASLVFHSDGTGDNWVKNRNGWEHNIYMRKETNLT